MGPKPLFLPAAQVLYYHLACSDPGGLDGMRQTFTRDPKRSSAFSDPFVKSSYEKDTSVRFQSEQFRAKT